MNKLLTITALALMLACAFSAAPAAPIPHCTDDGDSPCTACDAGYGVDADGGCAECSITNCALCSAAEDGCTSCDEGYGIKTSGGTTTCAACKVTNCGTCATNYETCGSCDDGYALDDNTCTACDNGCKECEKVDDSCDACPTGRVLNKTDTAAQFCCPTNCLECNSASFCTSCNTGYNLNSEKGTCFGFKTGASLTLGAIISVALFSLLF